jgi:hypothetical protein
MVRHSCDPVDAPLQEILALIVHRAGGRIVVDMGNPFDAVDIEMRIIDEGGRFILLTQERY